MHTVKELIEELEKCPQDYEVVIVAQENSTAHPLDTLAVVKEHKRVYLFMK